MIFDNIIPDTHKPFVNLIKQKEQTPKEVISEKLKRLKATKKASNELSDPEKVFYNLILAIDLDKEQNKMFKLKNKEMSNLLDQYER